MYSEIKNISLSEETYTNIGRATDKENAEKFKMQIQKYISTLKEIVEADFDKLTDKDLYELLTKFYSIALNENDYLKMVSKFNNKQYTFFHKIPTTMTFTDRTSEGHGRNFDWWEQLYQVYYIAATSDNIKFDYNKTYTKEEIKQMVVDKTIIILKQESKPIEDNPEFKQEKFESIPSLDIEIRNYGNNMSEFVLNNFHLFGELLRKKFPKRKVLKDMRKFIGILNEEIQDVFSNKGCLYSGTATICKNWFESSEEKKEYQSIQKKLSQIKKN